MLKDNPWQRSIAENSEWGQADFDLPWQCAKNLPCSGRPNKVFPGLPGVESHSCIIVYSLLFCNWNNSNIFKTVFIDNNILKNVPYDIDSNISKKWPYRYRYFQRSELIYIDIQEQCWHIFIDKKWPHWSVSFVILIYCWELW